MSCHLNLRTTSEIPLGFGAAPSATHPCALQATPSRSTVGAHFEVNLALGLNEAHPHQIAEHLLQSDILAKGRRKLHESDAANLPRIHGVEP